MTGVTITYVHYVCQAFGAGVMAKNAVIIVMNKFSWS